MGNNDFMCCKTAEKDYRPTQLNKDGFCLNSKQKASSTVLCILCTFIQNSSRAGY